MRKQEKVTLLAWATDGWESECECSLSETTFFETREALIEAFTKDYSNEDFLIWNTDDDLNMLDFYDFTNVGSVMNALKTFKPDLINSDYLEIYRELTGKVMTYEVQSISDGVYVNLAELRDMVIALDRLDRLPQFVVSVEGIDYTGKSTLVDALGKSMGIKTMTYPSKTSEEGKCVRASLQLNMQEDDREDLFLADAIEVSDRIKEYKRAIITDRSPLSQVIYRNEIDGMGYKYIDKLIENEVYIADMIILLSIDEKTLGDRIASRDGGKDIRENVSIETMMNRQRDYATVFDEYRVNYFHVVVNDKTEDELLAEVINLINIYATK